MESRLLVTVSCHDWSIWRTVEGGRERRARVPHILQGLTGLLAQTNQPNFTIQTQNPPPAFSFAVLGIALAISLAISVVVCLLLYNAQNAIPPEHRKIEPGMIWLLLIPLFNLVWNFFVFLRIPESYESYFRSIGRDVGDAGKKIGLAYAICAACSIIPCVGPFAGLAGLVLLIIFLVKIYQLKGQIGVPAGGFPVSPPSSAPPGPPTM
jgi:hypothetical protein